MPSCLILYWLPKLLCWNAGTAISAWQKSYSPFSNMFIFPFPSKPDATTKTESSSPPPPNSMLMALFLLPTRSLLPPYNTHRITPHSTLHYISTLLVKGYEKLRKQVETKHEILPLSDFWNIALSNITMTGKQEPPTSFRFSISLLKEQELPSHLDRGNIT